MASLYPKVWPGPSEKVSHAELDVLKQLSRLPEAWHVLHSLWLKTHERKLHAEADFVVITDRAVLILEVKGGDVWRDDQGWHFRTKSKSSENIKSEGPFDQARGAYHAIQTHLNEHGRAELFKEITWGYGVICPDCVLNIANGDPFVEPKMLLDEREYPTGLKDYLEGLTDYWIDRHESRARSGRNARSKSSTISPSRAQELLRILRPTFELAIGLGVESAHVERQLIALTERQLIALDFMALEPRNLLVGAAGTGKTVLLVEEARRRSAKGEKVLVLCFNKHLARRISVSLEKEKGIEVASYHQFALRLCAKSGVLIPFAESWDEFCESLRLGAEALISALTADDLYDFVLIDEGQDLMSPDFMGLVDCVLAGGLKRGRWLISCDVRQTIFRENFDAELLEHVSSLSRKTPLDINCRNTRQIAAYVVGFSGEGSQLTKGADGEMPIFRYFDGREEYLRIVKRVVNELVHSFAAVDIEASEIVLLYADSDFVPKEMSAPGFFLRKLVQFAPEGSNGDHIQVSSVQAFKGLEARAIVLLGISEFSSVASRGLFYVGASRARTNLRVILPKDCDHAKSVVPEISEALRAR